MKSFPALIAVTVIEVDHMQPGCLNLDEVKTWRTIRPESYADKSGTEAKSLVDSFRELGIETATVVSLTDNETIIVTESSEVLFDRVGTLLSELAKAG